MPVAMTGATPVEAHAGTRRVAIVGAGIIGSSWALVFARAGWEVRVFARHATVRASLHDRVRQGASAARAIAPEVAPDEIVSRIALAGSLPDALHGAEWVQESVEEDEEVKRSLFAELDAQASTDAILASSTSSIGASRFAGELARRERVIVAHPATPPHLIPVVEMVPAPFTDEGVVAQAFATMRAVGQVPVRVNGERPGFVMNRLQGALLTEMFGVVRDGLMTPADVDALIRDGFGLRWAWLGPLQGVDLNAPGGIADYLSRYGFMFDQMARERGATEPVVTPPIVATLDRAMREQLPLDRLPQRLAWRDERMAALRALRARLR
ncbi:MAG: 3-hydroxyacyl-CoA dehydrogenase [Gemmatimonadaceae bacterium]|nr:3-hydroxyacyl-CoA dehydrogenase [Gemmatimonadaceae bacterium]